MWLIKKNSVRRRQGALTEGCQIPGALSGYDNGWPGRPALLARPHHLPQSECCTGAVGCVRRRPQAFGVTPCQGCSLLCNCLELCCSAAHLLCFLVVLCFADRFLFQQGIKRQASILCLPQTAPQGYFAADHFRDITKMSNITHAATIP